MASRRHRRRGDRSRARRVPHPVRLRRGPRRRRRHRKRHLLPQSIHRSQPHRRRVRADGRKSFVTGTPVAQLFVVTCRVPGRASLRWLPVARDTPGVTVHDNWDDLGMRATGSNDVTFDHCPLPAEVVIGYGPWGQWSTPLLLEFVGALHVLLGRSSASPKQHATTSSAPSPYGARHRAARCSRDRPAVQQLIAEIEVALTAARATLADRARRSTTTSPRTRPGRTPTPICTSCSRTTSAPTSSSNGPREHRRHGHDGLRRQRLRRRQPPFAALPGRAGAGPFMQPYSPVEAWEYIARVALDRDPHLDV